jgi:type I restriction enzyme S subunit
VWTTGNEIFSPLRSCIPQGDTFIYVDIDAIDNKVNIINNPKIMRTADAPSRATRYTKAGDVLFSMVRPYLRNIAIVPENGWIASTGFYVCSPSKLLLSQYCYYLMLSDYVVDGLNQYMKGDNSPSINNSHILSWLYPIPPLTEQQRIVKEIERWFASIDEIEQDKSDLQTIIKQAKSKILDFAIHGKLVPQDPNDEPASELLKRINPEAEITCDNGHYPVGWIDVILGDIFYHNTGKALNSSNKEGVWRNYLTTSNVYWNQFDLSIIKQMPFKDNELEKCTVEKGDLLVCEGGDIGRSAIWNFDYNICIQNHIHRLRPKGDLNVLFYHYVLRFLKEYNLIGGKGIGLLGLSSNELHKIRMPLPPRKEQDRIVLKIEEMFSVLDNLQKALEA